MLIVAKESCRLSQNSNMSSGKSLFGFANPLGFLVVDAVSVKEK